MKTFTNVQKGMIGSQKWKALLVLVMLMCFSAGEVWADDPPRLLRTITTSVVGPGKIHYEYGLISGDITADQTKDLKPVTELDLTVVECTDNRYHFSKWTSDYSACNNSTSTHIQIDKRSGDKWVKAHFVKNQYDLILQVSPTGGGTVTGGGTFDWGTTRTVTATPASGYSFSCWKNGNTVVSYDMSFNYTIPTSTTTLTAYFVQQSSPIVFDISKQRVVFKADKTYDGTNPDGVHIAGQHKDSNKYKIVGNTETTNSTQTTDNTVAIETVNLRSNATNKGCTYDITLENVKINRSGKKNWPMVGGNGDSNDNCLSDGLYENVSHATYQYQYNHGNKATFDAGDGTVDVNLTLVGDNVLLGEEGSFATLQYHKWNKPLTISASQRPHFMGDTVANFNGVTREGRLTIQGTGKLRIEKPTFINSGACLGSAMAGGAGGVSSGWIVIESGDLTIQTGNPKLNESSWYSVGSYGAAIGGGACNRSGNITINGGKIDAYSCATPATIGGGGGQDGQGLEAEGTILINNGEINIHIKGNALAKDYGVGLGGGSSMNNRGGGASNITINGGTINVYRWQYTDASHYDEGEWVLGGDIGGGSSNVIGVTSGTGSGGNANVFIKGGTINARNIGGGNASQSGCVGGNAKIEMTGGSVYLSGSIGGGYSEYAKAGDASVYITGGLLDCVSIGGGNTNTGTPGKVYSTVSGRAGVHIEGDNLITLKAGYIGGGKNAAGNSIGMATAYINATHDDSMIQGQFILSNSISSDHCSFELVKGTIDNSQLGTGKYIRANANGGAVYMTDPYGAEVKIQGGTIKNCSGTYGGAIYMSAGTCTISGGTIKSSTSTRGGAIYMNAGTCTISGGTVGGTSLTEGNVASEYGGGLYMAGGTFTMRGGNLQYNSATTYDGGGIYIASGGQANIYGGTIKGNVATRNGGGFYVNPGSSITTNINSSVASTEISENGAVLGGGAYIRSGTVTVNQTSGRTTNIFGNTASNQGAGIYIYDGTFNLNAGSIGTNGHPNTSTKTGGGIYQRAGAFNMSGGSLSYNKGTTGGGGAFVNGGNVSITGGSVNGNFTDNSSANGGGILANGGNVTIKNATFDGNQANSQGGGIYANGSSTQVQIDPEGNGASVTRFQNNTANKGGGIYAQAQSVTVRHATFMHNTAASDGGGIYVKGPVTLNSGTSLVQNEATGNGGAVYVDGNTFTMTDGVTIGGSTANANKSNATSGNNNGGGGIYVTNSGSTVNIQGGEISYNTAQRYGGGLLMASTGGVTISGNAQVSHNGAVRGGGIFVTGGTVNISGTGVGVSQNTASQSGGGLYQNNGAITLTSAKVEGNTATSGDGGGLYLGNGTITISAAKVSGNNATNGKGGGIYASIDDNNNNNNGTTIIVKDGAQIGTYDAKAGSGNQANQGGGLYVNSGEMTFSDGVFGGNFASEQGGGIYIKEGATLDLQGTAKLTKNYVPADKKGGGVYMDGILKVGGGTSPSMLCEDNYAGTTSKLNNVYLPSYNKVVTLQSDIHSSANTHIGISVEQGFKPVVQSDTEPWLYNLMPNSGIMTGQLFDDAGKYIAIHTRDDEGSFEKQYIYFIGCWTTQVDTDPQAHLTDYPLPTGVDQHYQITSDGTYHIYTKEGLAWYSSLVNGLNDQTANPGLNAVLENDVDMDGYFWVPLGSVSGYNTSNSAFTEEGTGYTGTFNGQGHIITNLDCGYLTGIYKYGLFGAVNNGTVKNTFVDDYTFNLTSSTGKYKTGGIAGVIAGTTSVSNCVARGTTIDNANSASQYLRSGGLIGEMDELTAPKVHSCMAMPEFVINNSKNYNIGGLVGVNYQGTLENSYCNMKRTNNTTLSANEQDLRLGILAGYNSGTIANCYARLQEGTAALTTNEGWFVGYNASSGKIYYCYAPTDTPYVGRDESNGAGLIGHGTYGETSLLNGKYGFEQQDQQVTASNDHVENGAIDNTGELKGLLATLNNWVEAQTDGVAYSNWTRTMASPINGDYPILEFDDFVCAGSTDNVFISYKGNLSDMISEVNGNTNGGSIYLYGSNPVAVGANTNNNVCVYIPEHIGVKQAGNNTLNARVGVTFDNSAEDFMAYDWHMFSTPLTAAPLGITYNYTTPYGAGEVIEASGITLTSQGYFPANTGFNNFDFYCYSEKDYHWINFKRNSNDHWHQDAPYSNISYTNESNLVQGKGYMMAVNQPTMLMADGTLTNADVEIGVTYTSDALDFKGANLIGNPYQSYLDFEEVANVNDGNNGKPNINIYYILDADQKGYLAYTADASTQPEVEGTEGVASRYIHPHQGFFVKVDGNARAKFTSDMRKTLAEVEADNETSVFRGARIAYPLVNLKCTDSEGRNDFSTVEVNRPEQGGGEKALGLHTGNASIWAHVGDTDYHTAFTTEGTTTVPVRFKAYDDDTFTLSWNTQNGEFSYLHLIDNITGMDIDCLATDKYVFEGKTDDYTSRFKLVFGQANEDEDVDGSMIGSTFAFMMGDELVVNGEGLLQVFDMSGRQLVSTQLHGVQSTVSLPTVANGVYLMHLTNDNQVKTQKMVINK